MNNKVSLIPAPAAALRDSGLSRIDFSDGYAGQTTLPYADAEQAARDIFSHPPALVQALMSLRNVLVAPFGLKASVDFKDDGRGQVNVFPIISNTGAQIIVGANDKHLDFRIAVSNQASAQGSAVTISTMVKINRPLGRAYLALVMPFHKLFSRSLLQRALDRRDGGSAQAGVQR